MERKVVLAIDPGSSKCGLALVVRAKVGELDLLWHNVVPTESLESMMIEARAVEPYNMIIVGNGTSSSTILDRIRESFPAIGVLVVNERDTTLQAREKYWQHHPRKGWRRLFPSSMQVPPEAYDDFAAFVLAERVLLGTA